MTYRLQCPPLSVIEIRENLQSQFKRCTKFLRHVNHERALRQFTAITWNRRPSSAVTTVPCMTGQLIPYHRLFCFSEQPGYRQVGKINSGGKISIDLKPTTKYYSQILLGPFLYHTLNSRFWRQIQVPTIATLRPIPPNTRLVTTSTKSNTKRYLPADCHLLHWSIHQSNNRTFLSRLIKTPEDKRALLDDILYVQSACC